jgi:hypothetical protein
VQPGFLHALPLQAQRLAPLGRQVLVLRQDVLDGVLVHRHALLAAVVLQPAQPVAAAAEVVEVAQRQLALELFVAGKAAVGRQGQQVRLDALQVAVLLQRRPKVAKVLLSELVGMAHTARRNT